MANRVAHRVATTRALPVPVFSKFDRGTVRNVHANWPLLIAAGLFLAVLIADAVLIAAAAPSLAEIGSLYVTVT